MVLEQQNQPNQQSSETGFEMKQSTMPDHVEQVDNTFANTRPMLVVGEGATEGGLPDDVF